MMRSIKDEILEIASLLKKKSSEGEGSRGGKVIGHTRSGKPIYEHADHAKHKEFTNMDHYDAGEHHKAQVKKLTDYSSGKPKYKSPADEAAVKHHKQQANKHLSKAVTKPSEW